MKSQVPSLDAWGVTILHEIIHAIIFANQFSYGDISQYSQMALYWIDYMSSMLTTVFNFTDQDATAAALSGTDKALKEVGFTTSEINNLLFTSYNMTRSTADSLYNYYSWGVKGTTCQ